MEKNSNPDIQPNSAFEATSGGQVNSAFEAASGSQVNSAFEPALNQQGASAFESSSGVGSAFESDEDSAQSKARSRTFGLVDNKGYRHTLWGEEILRNQGAMSIVSTAWLQEESSEQKVLIKRIQGDADPNKVVLFSNEALITCENGSRGRHLAHGKFMGKDSQGSSFLVMEYYEGNNLEKKIEAGVYETNPGRCKAVIRGILDVDYCLRVDCLPLHPNLVSYGRFLGIGFLKYGLWFQPRYLYSVAANRYEKPAHAGFWAG